MIEFYIFIFLILLLILISYAVFILDSIILSHDLPTSKKAIYKIKDIILKFSPQASNFYDLGCGRGTVVLGIKKLLPNLEVYGIDKNPLRIFIAKLKAIFLRRKINFIKKNIFDVDLSNAQIIYTYLYYDLMPILEEKIKKESKSGTLIITNTSHFLNWQFIATIDTWDKKDLKDKNFERLFVYKKE
jgi:SAM-dependent methyltransferase